MLSTSQTIRGEVPRANRVAILRHRDKDPSANQLPEKLKRHQHQYRKRKAAGLCSFGGCTSGTSSKHSYCIRHLQRMSKCANQRYNRRDKQTLCIYCGVRPQFWGVRCVICRQRFVSDPLPLGARRALRLYREAEKKYWTERVQVEARRMVRHSLARGQVVGKNARALSLYAGLDNGKWRTYEQIGKIMKISKERVRQLLLPSKIAIGRVLGNDVPWKPLQTDI